MPENIGMMLILSFNLHSIWLQILNIAPFYNTNTILGSSSDLLLEYILNKHPALMWPSSQKLFYLDGLSFTLI